MVFGLKKPAPLNPDLSPYELVERLSRLATTVGDLTASEKRGLGQSNN